MIPSDKVRAYIRDRAELNVLLDNKEQYDDDEIGMFNEDVLEELLIQFPALKAQKNRIPDQVVLYGIISKLFEMVAQQEHRNQMVVGDDNVGQIDYSNKADKYLNFAQIYENKKNSLAQTFTASSFYRDTWGDVTMGSSDFEFYAGV